MNRNSSYSYRQVIILLILVGIVYSCIDSDFLTPDPDTPIISEIIPESGPPGINVTINGEKFNGIPGQDSVFFNGKFAEIVSAASISLVVTVPDSATTGPVLVRSNGKSALGPDFTVETGLPMLQIHEINPNSGVIGSEVEIIGANFGEDKDNIIVRFGLDTAIINSVTDTLINTVVPPGASTGPITIIKDGIMIVGPVFTVLEDSPIIYSLKPDHGPVGTEVWIIGKNFSSVTEQNKVLFSGDTALVVEGNNDSLRTIVPDDAKTGPVEVIVNGLSAIGPEFIVETSQIEITSINPDKGTVGITVIVSGKNFGNANDDITVTFNGINATIINISSTQLDVIVPDGATTGPVVVTVNGLSATGPVFTVETTPPQITSIDPTSGQVGIKLTITGTNFSNTIAENTVTFNGTNADITSASTTELVIIVPNGATTGPVVVTVNGLSAIGPVFTVEADPPVIASINPTSGVFDTEVTISGSNFSDVPNENQVTFNGMDATIISTSSTTLVAKVPLGAGTGAVSVTTNGLTDIGPTFTYIKSVFVKTHAGNGNAGFVNGPRASAQFNGPSKMAIKGNGEIVLADVNNHRIRLIDSKNEVSTIAGDGTSGLINGNVSIARFARPNGVAIDNSGNIYVADFDNHVIRKISTSNIVSTYAGNGQPGYIDGSAGVASFNGPIDVAVDASGNVYVADLYNHAVRKIDINGNVMTLAGNGTAGFTDGKGNGARFNYPSGLGIDNLNDLYVADLSNHAIRKVAFNGDVTTIAGDGTAGSNEGSTSVARFRFPIDVDLDGLGNIYVADDKNHKIRIIKTNNTVETFAGSGTEGFLDGLGSDARFNDPTGITVVNNELMYVGDTENNRVRIITLE